MRRADVTGLGLATSLGPDAATAASAARAGIVRLADLALTIEHEGETEPIVGHLAPGVSDLEGEGPRLLRLVRMALEDVAASTPPATLQTAHWLVSLPEGLPTTPPPPLSDLDAPPAPAPALERADLEAGALRRHIEDVLEVAIAPWQVETFQGRTGFVRAVGHARVLAQQGETAVIGVVDSRVDLEVAPHVAGS